MEQIQLVGKQLIIQVKRGSTSSYYHVLVEMQTEKFIKYKHLTTGVVIVVPLAEFNNAQSDTTVVEVIETPSNFDFDTSVASFNSFCNFYKDVIIPEEQKTYKKVNLPPENELGDICTCTSPRIFTPLEIEKSATSFDAEMLKDDAAIRKEKQSKASEVKQGEQKMLLDKLLAKLSKVTAFHRHSTHIPKQALDELSNAQLAYERGMLYSKPPADESSIATAKYLLCRLQGTEPFEDWWPLISYSSKLRKVEKIRMVVDEILSVCMFEQDKIVWEAVKRVLPSLVELSSFSTVSAR